MCGAPIPLARRSSARICGISVAGIVGSDSAGGIDVCPLWVLCDVRYSPLRRADPSSRGGEPSVVCRCVIVNPRQWGGLGPLGLSSHGKKRCDAAVICTFRVVIVSARLTREMNGTGCHATDTRELSQDLAFTFLIWDSFVISDANNRLSIYVNSISGLNASVKMRTADFRVA